MSLVGILIKSLTPGYHRFMNRDGVPIQSGALPWRLRKRRRAEVMLVTGRRSKRWMIPKGWPMFGKSLAESAAQEAFEEAGIKGKVNPKPIGRFRHVKQHVLLGDIEVEIQVHTMAVQRELDNWPERGERSRKWFELSEAAARVDSEELRTLIVEFGKRLRIGGKKSAAA
jgi:8-oxo-dGTP pyrophosphatase MutT (NUDIX family)